MINKMLVWLGLRPSPKEIASSIVEEMDYCDTCGYLKGVACTCVVKKGE